MSLDPSKRQMGLHLAGITAFVVGLMSPGSAQAQFHEPPGLCGWFLDLPQEDPIAVELPQGAPLIIEGDFWTSWNCEGQEPDDAYILTRHGDDTFIPGTLVADEDQGLIAWFPDEPLEIGKTYTAELRHNIDPNGSGFELEMRTFVLTITGDPLPAAPVAVDLALSNTGRSEVACCHGNQDADCDIATCNVRLQAAAQVDFESFEGDPNVDPRRWWVFTLEATLGESETPRVLWEGFLEGDSIARSLSSFLAPPWPQEICVRLLQRRFDEDTGVEIIPWVCAAPQTLVDGLACTEDAAPACSEGPAPPEDDTESSNNDAPPQDHNDPPASDEPAEADLGRSSRKAVGCQTLPLSGPDLPLWPLWVSVAMLCAAACRRARKRA